jgi:hypothetical protein
MSVKIKKVILNDKGEVIEEYEGTEEEVEAYEKKRSKKQESVQRRKELLKDEIRRMIKEEIAAAPTKIEHHFHTNTEIRYMPAPVINPGRWVEPWQPYTPGPIWIATNGDNTSGLLDQSKVTYTGVSSNQITLKS